MKYYCFCCSLQAKLVAGARQSIRYGLDNPRFESRQVQEVYMFSETSRPVLLPSQTHIQHEVEDLFHRKQAAVARV
jgi:hypothetical protein